jgi:ABC-type lipoprotein release transport system permease subunit
VGLSVFLGLGLAVVVGRLVPNQLYEVLALDPLTFFVTPVLVVAVAMMAGLLPARRAMMVDPVEAIRTE